MAFRQHHQGVNLKCSLFWCPNCNAPKDGKNHCHSIQSLTQLPKTWGQFRGSANVMIKWITKRGSWRWRWVTPIRSDLRVLLYQLPNVSLSDSGMYLLMMKEFGPTHEVFIEKPWKHVSKMRSLYANWPGWPQLFFFVAQKFQFLTFKGTSRKPNCLTLKKKHLLQAVHKQSKQQPHFPSVSKALTLPVDPSKS